MTNHTADKPGRIAKFATLFCLAALVVSCASKSGEASYRGSNTTKLNVIQPEAFPKDTGRAAVEPTLADGTSISFSVNSDATLKSSNSGPVQVAEFVQESMCCWGPITTWTFGKAGHIRIEVVQHSGPDQYQKVDVALFDPSAITPSTPEDLGDGAWHSVFVWREEFSIDVVASGLQGDPEKFMAAVATNMFPASDTPALDGMALRVGGEFTRVGSRLKNAEKPKISSGVTSDWSIADAATGRSFDARLSTYAIDNPAGYAIDQVLDPQIGVVRYWQGRQVLVNRSNTYAPAVASWLDHGYLVVVSIPAANESVLERVVGAVKASAG